MELQKPERPGYRSPLRVLVHFFRKSRDRWKAKYKNLQEKLKAYRTRIRDLERSRDKWRTRAETLEREREAVREQQRTALQTTTAVVPWSPPALSLSPAAGT